MTNCKEYTLDDLLAITAIPVSDISASDTYSPVNRLTPTIPEEDFNLTLTNAIVIGRQPATADGALIPIRRNTGKAKDDESDSVAGRLHTVSVSCEVDDRDSSKDANNKTVFDLLLTLERTPSHLLLMFRNGERAFVSATEDTYQCSVERDGAKTSVSFKIYCFMGVQLLV